MGKSQDSAVDAFTPLAENLFKKYDLLLLIILLLAACRPAPEKSTPSAKNTPASSENSQVVIPESTVIITGQTASALLQISSDKSELIFDAQAEELEDLEQGDVLVGEPSDAAPDGYLRRVTAIQTDGEQIIVETVQATLTEAIQDGELKIEQTLTPADIETAWALPGARLKPAPRALRNSDAFIFEFGTVLYDVDGDESTTGDQVRLDGSTIIEPSFEFDLIIDGFEIEHLYFASTITETAELVFTATGQGSLDGEKMVAQYTMHTIRVLVGGVLPVTVRPVLTVMVGVNGQIHTSLTSRIDQQATFTGGLAYSDGDWRTISEFSNQFDFVPPVSRVDVQARGYVGPSISLVFYGIVAPYITPQLYLRLEAHFVSSGAYDFGLYGGLDVLVGVVVKIFSKVLADEERLLINHEIPLLEIHDEEATLTPTPTPTPTATPSPVPTRVDCENNLLYLQDISILDGARFNPGDLIYKSWLVQNSGTCTWTEDYSWVPIRGEAMEGEPIHPETTAPGERAYLSVWLVVPATPGEHIGYWQMTDETGEPFGDELYIQIITRGAGVSRGGLTNVDVSRRNITLSLRDDATVDGDRVDLIVNGVTIVSNYTLTETWQAFPVTLRQGSNTVTIVALNEGSRSPNTAGIFVSHVISGLPEQISADLHTGESDSFIIRAP